MAVLVVAAVAACLEPEVLAESVLRDRTAAASPITAAEPMADSDSTEEAVVEAVVTAVAPPVPMAGQVVPEAAGGPF